MFRERKFYWDEVLPITHPLVMYMFGGENTFLDAMKMYALIIVFGSFIFSVIALNAGHHHPDILHDGDKIRFVSHKSFPLDDIFTFNGFVFFSVSIPVMVTIGVFIQLIRLWSVKSSKEINY